MSDLRFELDGWCYHDKPKEGGDARKIVSIELGGMVWVGIRAWNHTKRIWMNNGEPNHERIIAWRDLPEPAKGYFVSGMLYGAKP